MTTQEPLVEVIGLEHVNVKARDMQRSIDFYAGVLGLRLVRLDRDGEGAMRFASLRAGDALIDIQPDASDAWTSGAGGFNHFALLIEPADLDAVAARCRELNIPITEGPVTNRRGAYGPGGALYIEDPDGHGIELKQYGV